MSEPSDLRVSDDDREQAARAIREHFAVGRLTEEELGERIDSVYRARTQEELRALSADLPQLPVTRAQQKAELAERRAALRRRTLQEAGGGLGAFALCTFIWATSGASGSFWPIWVALAALVPLVRNGWRLYGPSPELGRLEEELERAERSGWRAGARAARRERRRGA